MRLRNLRKHRFRAVARAVGVLALSGLLLAAPAVAQGGQSSGEEASSTESTDGVSKEIEKLKRLLERLQERIEELENELRTAKDARERDELKKLLEEAEAESAAAMEKEKEAEAQRETFVGRQRSLQALNPEISFLGDVSYDWTDTNVRDQFLVRGVEISFQAPLDPYTRFKGFLAGHQEPAALEHEHEEEPVEQDEHGHGHGDEIEVGIEEAYMEWVALPGNMRLRVGKFRQQFGTLNRWHPHALPSVDMPFALRNAFGHDGLVGLGVGADWQLPKLWASSNGLTLEVVNADNASAFAGSEFEDPTYLLRHTGFFDLGPDTYFEVGLNGVTGPNSHEPGLDTTIASLDFNFVWEPVQRAKYRSIELRGEILRSRFDTEDAGTFDSTSMYAYLSWKFARRWIAGVRFDDAELPSPRIELHDEQEVTEGLRERAWSPYLTFWQSEFVRLRLQYQHVTRDFEWAHGPDDDDRLWLQVTFAAGPHKHESY